MAPRGIGLPALLVLAVIACCAGCAPLESGTPRKTGWPETGVDRSHTVNLVGVLRDHDGTGLTGVVSVLFAIYEQPKDGAPLWQEVQNVEPDDRGRFTALVGSTRSEGIPAYLFDAEKTRWLGVEVLLSGEVEQPRIRVTSGSLGLMTTPFMWLANWTASGNQPALPGPSGDQSASTPASAETQQGSGQTADSKDSNSNPDQTDDTDQRRAGWRQLPRLPTQ
jgi:hypothetical protein